MEKRGLIVEADEDSLDAAFQKHYDENDGNCFKDFDENTIIDKVLS